MTSEGARCRHGPAFGMAFVLFLGACGDLDRPADGGRPDTLSEPASLRVEDQAGQVVRLERPPTRIVSLVPAATEILVDLGAAELLVARTDYDADPRVAALPSVGGGIGPSLERIVSVSPDLVIRFEGEQDRATPPALDRAAIPHLAVRPDGLADIRDMILLLGRISSREARAEALLGRIDAELAAVAARVEGAPRPSVAFVLGGDPPWVVAEGTFMHELLEIAGGTNALSGEGLLYAPISIEEIVRREVDLILAPESARIPRALSALPVARVPDDVQSPGIGLGRSARAISRLLHPERWR